MNMHTNTRMHNKADHTPEQCEFSITGKNIPVAFYPSQFKPWGWWEGTELEIESGYKNSQLPGTKKRTAEVAVVSQNQGTLW